MALIKTSGTLHLLLGLLLLLVLVGGQNTPALSADASTMAQSLTEAPMHVHETTIPSSSQTSVMAATHMAHSTVSSTNGGTVITTATQSLTSTSGGSDQSTTQPLTSASRGSGPSTTQSLTSIFESMASSSTHSATSTSGGSSSNTPRTSTTKGSSASSSSIMSSSSSPSVMASYSSGMGATSNATSMNMLWCPSFMCSYSECYSMYTSHNATECTDANHCHLMRCPDMMYNVSCSDTCEESCNSTSQVNCSVNCCNSTGCLNNTFASMMMTSTMAMTTTSTSQSSSTTTSTTASKGNKCQTGTCSGDTCYTGFKSNMPETCSSSQPYCQLKKTTTGSTVSWTAGCADCSKETVCKATTVPPCVLECCNATVTSCLVLDGTTNVNVNSFAARSPRLHTELIASLLCLLSITLLL